MDKKKIVITGASRGIGFKLAELFLKQGHKVLALSRNTTSLEEFKSKYQNFTCLPIDISNDKQIDQVYHFVAENWKGIDILIHNAGKLINKPFKDTCTSDFLEVYHVNVFAVAELTRVMLPFFKNNSHIVAISSMGGIQGSAKFPGLSAYSSSKGALITLMELLAEEYKDKGIAFNTLALGAVQTEMLALAFPGYKAPISAEEMANYIAEFALTGNKYFNGKVLQVSSSTP